MCDFSRYTFTMNKNTKRCIYKTKNIFNIKEIHKIDRYNFQSVHKLELVLALKKNSHPFQEKQQCH